MKKYLISLTLILILSLFIAGCDKESTEASGFTKCTHLCQDCIFYESGRSCAVDKQYCNQDGTEWYRSDLDCFRDGETIGEICIDQDAYYKYDDPMNGGYTGTDYSCMETIVMNCELSGTTEDALQYCDLYCEFTDENPNFKICNGGCNSNFQCAGEIQGCENPYGLEGYQFCINNNVMECQNNQWVLLKECTTSVCVEETYFYSRCGTNVWYCLNNNFNCITTSNYDPDKCSTTKEGCESKIKYYCLSTDRKSCTQRLGGCLDGELYYKGNDLDNVKIQCESQICGQKNNRCCAYDECDDGLVCMQHPSDTEADGSPLMLCLEENTENICKSICEDEAWLKVGNKVIIPNQMCIWKCELKEFFKPMLIGASILLGIIIMLITVATMRKYYRKKKDIWIHWTFGIILGLAFGLFLYFYILLLLIILAIYIIIIIIANIYGKKR